MENASDYSIESVVQNQQSVLPKAFLDVMEYLRYDF